MFLSDVAIKRPVFATMLMVANTGRLMETSDRNISQLDKGDSARGAGPATPASAAASAGVFADDGHQHSATEAPDVAGNYAIVGLQSVDDLNDAEVLVDDTSLHPRDVDRFAID